MNPADVDRYRALLREQADPKRAAGGRPRGWFAGASTSAAVAAHPVSRETPRPAFARLQATEFASPSQAAHRPRPTPPEPAPSTVVEPPAHEREPAPASPAEAASARIQTPPEAAAAQPFVPLRAAVQIDLADYLPTPRAAAPAPSPVLEPPPIILSEPAADPEPEPLELSREAIADPEPSAGAFGRRDLVKPPPSAPVEPGAAEAEPASDGAALPGLGETLAQPEAVGRSGDRPPRGDPLASVHDVQPAGPEIEGEVDIEGETETAILLRDLVSLLKAERNIVEIWRTFGRLAA